MKSRKVVVLAGGLGTRLSEETSVRPKPMVEIGGAPILWHILKIYSHYGFNDFVVCLGYKGNVIKEFFSEYFLRMSDVTFDIKNNTMCAHRQTAEPWTVTLIDTGDNTATGGRLRRVREYLKDEPYFLMTYGDGVADVDIGRLARFHVEHGRLATVTAVRPPSRFGRLNVRGTSVLGFEEKPDDEGGWINGGFFVLSNKVLDFISGDDTVWESDPLPRIAEMGELQGFFHDGFWQPMDTLRDKIKLEQLWASGTAPWKVW